MSDDAERWVPPAEWFGPPMAVPPESGHILWTYVECAFEDRIGGHRDPDGTYACCPHVMVSYVREALIESIALLAKQGIER